MTTILCIEDEPDMRELIVTRLESAGYHTLEAGTAAEGLRLINRSRPDLTLCDIRLPDMDGYGLLMELRFHHPKAALMPFIFLTGMDAREDRLKGLALGAGDYITKPVDFELLLAVIHTHLNMVERIRERHERELVRLYRALGEKADAPKGAKPAPGTAGIPIPREELPAAAGPLVVGACSDSVSVRRLRGVVERAGLSFLGSTSGAHILRVAEKRQPVVAFLSYQTDDMIGAILARELRSRSPGTGCIQIAPPELGRLPDPSRMPDIDDAIFFPCPDRDLMNALTPWIEAAKALAATARPMGGRP
ncbi:response regulator transcription factor [Caenispirillum salinarum]|uniref:response regulator transcription factor n=1 Tax=Caenispirillum salinarum TaxID=859058 RepID=UPI00384FC8DE